MDIKEVYKLIDMFDASDLSELKLSMDGMKLAVRKGSAVSNEKISKIVADSKDDVAEVKASENNDEADEDIILIKAPLVGTFYRAASPEDKPFVMVGQKISRGDVVGIVEAMKLMNEINAPEEGVILSIEAMDGELVEYGRVLIKMRRV